MINQTEQRNTNYNRLREYLKHTELSIDKTLFKTTLYAINAVTIYNKTIPESFKLSIDKYQLDYDHFQVLKGILYKMFYSNGECRTLSNEE